MMRQFREWTGEDQKRCDFYKQFIAKGDLVFDVGANSGNRTKVFSRLGAIVIAVEPQPECAEFLREVFKDERDVCLIQTALGAAKGQAEMMICSAHTISSLSPAWIRAVKESGRFAKYEWNRTATVSVDTLDNLMAQYGCPRFIKIDVEGFEDQVIFGLSSRVAAISMEFTPEFIESTYACVRHLCRMGRCQFQISFGESMEFALPNWVASDEIRRRLSEVPMNAFGDLYARFIAD
jgi:FkbM family methyltransferase